MRPTAAERRVQIVSEAARLFGAQGYDKVTIKDIARACSITEPALYRHFKSKESIFDAVLAGLPFRVDYNQLFERLSAEDDLETILRGIADHILTFYRGNRDLYRLLLYSSLQEHTKAKQVFKAIRGGYVRFLQDRLEKLSEQGRLASVQTEITARCFVGMVFDCSLSATLFKKYQGRTYKPSEVIANNVPIYVRGLTGG